MTFFLYRLFPKTNFSEGQKIRSVHRQWRLHAPLLILILPLVVEVIVKGRIPTSGPTFWESSEFGKLLVVIISFVGIVCQLLLMREMIAYKVAWVGRSIFSSRSFWNDYQEILKPVGLYAAMVIEIILACVYLQLFLHSLGL